MRKELPTYELEVYDHITRKPIRIFPLVGYLDQVIRTTWKIMQEYKTTYNCKTVDALLKDANGHVIRAWLDY